MYNRLCDHRAQPTWFAIHLIEDRDGTSTQDLLWVLRQEGHACHPAESDDCLGVIEARINAVHPVDELIRLMRLAAVAGYCIPLVDA